jgi:hypothetical protein
MPYNFLNAIKDNLKCDIDLGLNPFKCQTELDCNLTTPNNDV